MGDVKDARDHNKSKIAGSTKFVKFTVVSTPSRSCKTTDEKKIKKKRWDKPGRIKAEAKHIKLNLG